MRSLTAARVNCRFAGSVSCSELPAPASIGCDLLRMAMTIRRCCGGSTSAAGRGARGQPQARLRRSGRNRAPRSRRRGTRFSLVCCAVLRSSGRTRSGALTTYIPMGRGFLYLVVIMDLASRAVLGLRLSAVEHHGRHVLP